MSEPAPPASFAASTPSPEVIREFNDRGTLWLFEDPQHVRELLMLLEPGVAAQLDFARAERVNRSFVPADLRKLESDLIFSVPRAGAGRRAPEILVYVLLEHQSQRDPLMALRLYRYMGQLWDAQCRLWDDARTPSRARRLRPVVPLVLYTGAAAWPQPIRLDALVQAPGALRRFVPEWETLFLNLHATPPEALTGAGAGVGWALRVLQEENAPLEELEGVLRDAMSGLEALPSEHAGQWLRIAWYLLLLIFHRREEAEYTELQQVLHDHARRSQFRHRETETQMALTMAQAVEQRGEARGEVRALRDALRITLTGRFSAVPSHLESALTAADAATLKRWLEAAARAETLAEFEEATRQRAPRE